VAGRDRALNRRLPGGWRTPIKFQCSRCGAEVVVKFLKPGEEAQCQHCGAYVTVPETSFEADAEPDLTKTRQYRGAGKRREWPFVPCPACGGGELKIIVFWGIPYLVVWWFQNHFKVIPVKCKKCGAKFDGLSGRYIDEELSSVRNIRYLCIALYVMIGLFIVVAIIAK
jgi:DNA-directed RNA polymerase subunit RPC12/RpoP